MARHNDFNIQVLIARITDDFFNFPFGLVLSFGPLRNPHEDAGTAAGAAVLFQGDVYILSEPFIIGRDKSGRLLPVVRADERLVGSFIDKENFAFPFPLARARQKPYRNGIVIHGTAAIFFGDINIFFSVRCNDKAERFRITLIYTCYVGGLLRFLPLFRRKFHCIKLPFYLLDPL